MRFTANTTIMHVKCVECGGANGTSDPFCSDLCEATAINRNG